MKSIEVRNIAFPVARDLVDGALAHAQSKVWSVAVAVVDSELCPKVGDGPHQAAI